jgi:hypothetical protein
MDAREVIEMAMRNSKAWPVVFGGGSAEALADAAVKALDEAGYKIVLKRAMTILTPEKICPESKNLKELKRRNFAIKHTLDR